MRGKNLFFDKTDLHAHDRWPDKLKNIASHCQVLLVVVGQNWAEQLEQRREKGFVLPAETTDWNSLDHVDWVVAELYWALAREHPAHLVVCYWGNAPELDVDRLFPAELQDLAQVRAAFGKDKKRQFLRHSAQGDDNKLVAAVSKGMLAFNSAGQTRTQPVSVKTDTAAAAANPSHWLRFLNRTQQWAEIAQALDAPVIGAKRFPPVPSEKCANSAAFLWGIEHDDDECQEFAIAINHHLFAKGELVQKLGDAGSTDVDSMTVVAGDRAVDVLASIFDKMNSGILPESVAPKCGQEILQAQVVMPLKNAVMTFDELPHCIYAYTQVDSSAASAVLLEELRLFCALWNRCDWTPLNGRRLAVLVFVKCKHDKAKWWQFAKRSPIALPETSIGEIDADCIDTWRDFMQHKLKLSDQLGPLFDALTPERFDTPIRYKALKQKLGKKDDS